MKCLLLQISAKKMYCDFKKGINLQFMFQWKVKPLQHFGKLVHYDTTNAKDKNEPLQESIIFACSQCPCPRDAVLYNTLLPVCTCLELRMKKLYYRNDEHTQCGSLNNLWIFADSRLILALRTKGTSVRATCVLPMKVVHLSESDHRDRLNCKQPGYFTFCCYIFCSFSSYFAILMTLILLH